MSEQDNALMFVEMIADSELGSVSEHVLRGALVRCINLLKAARSESEDAQRSEASQPVLPGELVEAVRDFIKVIRAAGLLNLSRGVQLGQVSWLVKATEGLDRLENAISYLPDPLPTVESVRAEYLAELIKRADDQCAKITDSSPLIVREALNASCWLRFQKGEG